MPPWKDVQDKANVYIRSWWVFVFSRGASVRHADSKLRSSQRAEMPQLFVSVWKVGGKEAFSWSESTVNRALHPAQLLCKWIRSFILWIPWGQADTDNCIFLFSLLCISLCLCLHGVCCLCWALKSPFSSVAFFVQGISEWNVQRLLISYKGICPPCIFRPLGEKV